MGGLYKPPGFDLLSEPWLPAVASDGSVVALGIRELLLKAHDLADIRCESPLETAAAIRTLLAVLYGAYCPETPGQWAAMWKTGSFQPDRLDDYLDGANCEGRFDLFSESRPFMQVRGLTMARQSPAAALSTEAATGNNPTLFDHASDDAPAAYSAGAAARALVASQAFALGFGKAGEAVIDGKEIERPYFADAICLRGVTVYLGGDNLFQTLMLNLVPGKATEIGVAAWERDDSVADLDRVVDKKRVTKKSLGVADRYAWRSRMVRLIPDADGTVKYLYFTQGREADKSPEDPMKVYVEDPKLGIYALNLNAGKASWRDLHAFVTCGKQRQSSILNHVARQVSDLGTIEPASLYRLNVIGLATDPGKAGKFLMWRHDRMSIPAALLSDEDALAALSIAISDAEAVGGEIRKRIGRVAWKYLPPRGNPDPKDVAALAEALDTRAEYWARLEGAFHNFVSRVAADNNIALGDWRKQVEREATSALRAACAKLGESVRAIRATADISYSFIADQHARALLAKTKGRKGKEAAVNG